ncbi:hypothetical protein COO60DRAFT_124487 [Scenedesmus sp. NREL 46B-D3]|nr:hypothetical protein COO60DRAFT_124487 [Scenedesmus sp. NREL 46B-D3]
MEQLHVLHKDSIFPAASVTVSCVVPAVLLLLLAAKLESQVSATMLRHVLAGLCGSTCLGAGSCTLHSHHCWAATLMLGHGLQMLWHASRQARLHQVCCRVRQTVKQSMIRILCVDMPLVVPPPPKHLNLALR